jgi:gamma-butyrobetaine dioxygenase
MPDDPGDTEVTLGAQTVARTLELYRGERAAALYDEVVTEREHALQAAGRAEAAGADDATIVAALLHDVGRLLIDGDGDPAHDRVGERYLRPRFGTAVSAPVGLHVAAKRYLCAVEPAYLEQLSPVSVRSLAVQGGPMSDAEVERFRANEGWEAAVRLRRWDDQAKDPDAATRQVEDYAPLLEALARQVST